jgi:hypothetical protein
VINCAGIVQSLSVLSIDEADFDRMINESEGRFNLPRDASYETSRLRLDSESPLLPLSVAVAWWWRSRGL